MPEDTGIVPEPGGREADLERLVERVHRVREDADALRRSLGDLADAAGGWFRLEVERSPYWTLSAAAGVGYVLGGGLPVRLTRWAAGFGGRVLVATLIRELASRAAEDERRT